MKQILLSPPHLCGKEKEFIEEAIISNWITTAGKNVEEFQKELKSFLGNSFQALALNSGTSALHLATILADVRPGDEVICQSMTFAAAANVILYQGALPVFVDSEPDSWNISPEHLEEAIVSRLALGKKPKAVIVTDLFGMPFDLEKVRKITDKYEITLIEDAAEAMGSAYAGQKCGTLGDLGAISFNGNKIITTSGGGALITQFTDDFAEAKYLSTQAKEPLPYYEHKSLGYNYAMSNVSAGIGRGQMTVLPQRIEKRRTINRFYRGRFSHCDFIFQQEPSSDYFSNFWLTAFRTANMPPRQLIDRLADHQIEARHVWKPMHLQPLYHEAPYYGENVAEKIFEQGICLPSGSSLTEEDLEYIAEVIIGS